MQLAERLDEQGSGNNLRYERISEIVSEKSSALETELVALRADVQVTMETLAARLDAVPESPGRDAFESLHQRLSELQSAVTSRERSDVGLAEERERYFAAEMASLKTEIQASIRELSTRLEAIPDEQDSDALHEIRKQLGDLQLSLTTREDREAAVIDERQRAFAAALDEELVSLRADIRSAVESVSAEQAGTFGEHERDTLLSLEPQLQKTVLDLQGGNERALQEFGERELALKGDIASLHRDLAALAEAVSRAGTGSVDHSTDLQALQDSLATMVSEINQVREEQRALLSAHGQAVHEELAASQDVLLETSIAIRDANASGPALTPETIGEIISTRLGALQSNWNEAQTEQYRQLISHVSEIQVDLDNVSTVMQAIQPNDSDASGLDSSVLEQVKALLEALQVRAPEGENTASIDEFNRLRYEIQGLRSDLQSALQAESTRANEGAVGAPDFTLDDVVRVIATQLNAEKAEDNRLATNRENVLRHELAQIRQEMQTAVQQARAAASNGGTSAPPLDLSELHAEVAQIRAGLAREPDPQDNELRGELAQFRQDLHSVVDSLRGAAAEASADSDHDNLLTERVAELELALQQSQNDQRRWLEERDAALHTQFEELRASLISAVSDTQPSHDKADDDAWREELIRLQGEIADLAKLSEAREVHADSPIVDLLAALRSEMVQAMESATASNVIESTNSSDSAAIQDGLTALAASLQQSNANQERIVESQKQSLQAATTQMRDEMRTALSGLTRESIDTFEKRQSQLRMDQLEMERNLAQLRQELVATQADPSNKKKLWR
jgi:hypothetical protein